MIGPKGSRHGVAWLERSVESGGDDDALKCLFRVDIMEFTLKTSIFTRQEMSENSILFSVNIAIF